MTNKTTLLLIAQRHALGLNASELADLPTINQTHRTVANYERGDRNPSSNYIESMREISVLYYHLQASITTDIGLQKRQTSTPTLPYFVDFNDFERITGNNCKTYWRVWQSVIGHIVLIGDIDNLGDDASVPASFKQTWYWLGRGYDVVGLAEDITNHDLLNKTPP